MGRLSWIMSRVNLVTKVFVRRRQKKLTTQESVGKKEQGQEKGP